MQLTDWIEHDGKARPNLAPGTPVLVKIEGVYDEDEQGLSPGPWEFWDESDDIHSSWLLFPGDPRDSVITHYKVATE